MTPKKVKDNYIKDDLFKDYFLSDTKEFNTANKENDLVPLTEELIKDRIVKEQKRGEEAGKWPVNSKIGTIKDTPLHSKSAEFIKILIGRQRFAIYINLIKEIIKDPVITPYQSSHRYIKGIIQLRKAIIPIINLDTFFEMQPAKKGGDNFVIVVYFNQRYAGLLVDKVLESLFVSTGKIARLPVKTGINNTYYDGIIKESNNSNLILILHINNILSQITL